MAASPPPRPQSSAAGLVLPPMAALREGMAMFVSAEKPRALNISKQATQKADHSPFSGGWA